ncbi:MAG TPA: DUF2652 domain-containing protein [bacterium]|jgi:hypothetical protein
MAAVEHGCLVIADIAGYTKYVAGVELEHSQDILADLMNTVVSQMRGLLHLAKLEGDAVFCYAHDGDTDGSTLLAMVQSCYNAFAKRQQLIDRHTTCECNACRLIPTLNLKFLIHHGEYIIHEIAGSRELVGRDVIVAHRLLKNSVTKQTGIHGYAMVTEPCVRYFGFDPSALGLIEHTEEYDDVGAIRGYVMDLEARWKDDQERRVVYVGPDDGALLAEVDLPAPPAIIWDYITTPAKRAMWQVDTLRIDEASPTGVRGVGTRNHCVHGAFVVDEEILDWKPFRYYTDRSVLPIGSVIFTAELSVSPDGLHTRVTVRARPEGGPEQVAMLEQMLPQIREMYDLGIKALTALLTNVRSAAEERAASLTT